MVPQPDSGRAPRLRVDPPHRTVLRDACPDAAGTGSIGRDFAAAVSKEYAAPARFKGGTILQIEVNIGDDQYVDLEKHAAAMLARQ